MPRPRTKKEAPANVVPLFPMEECAIMPFGKHKGLALETLIQELPNYVDWLLDQEAGHDSMAKVQAALRQLMGQDESNQKAPPVYTKAKAGKTSAGKQVKNDEILRCKHCKGEEFTVQRERKIHGFTMVCVKCGTAEHFGLVYDVKTSSLIMSGCGSKEPVGLYERRNQ